jgi:hypothetical protein
MMPKIADRAAILAARLHTGPRPRQYRLLYAAEDKTHERLPKQRNKYRRTEGSTSHASAVASIQSNHQNDAYRPHINRRDR